MKKIISLLLLSVFLFNSCKKDEEVTCMTCSSEDTIDFEICRENDGNASVNGENTSTPYDQYLQGLLDIGVHCR